MVAREGRNGAGFATGSSSTRRTTGGDPQATARRGLFRAVGYRGVLETLRQLGRL